MKELVCIVCPNGCTLGIEGEGENIKVTGNKCKRGVDFAISEMTCPMRTVCSTVKTAFTGCPVLPVRVSKEIPKDKIFDIMRELDKITVKTPLKRGETVIENILGLGADIIATSSILISVSGKENKNE